MHSKVNQKLICFTYLVLTRAQDKTRQENAHYSNGSVVQLLNWGTVPWNSTDYYMYIFFIYSDSFMDVTFCQNNSIGFRVMHTAPMMYVYTSFVMCQNQDKSIRFRFE